MISKLIVANWKSNLDLHQVHNWLNNFVDKRKSMDIELVICPSSIYLPVINQTISEKKLNLTLGIQDISPFPNGAYTGEINAQQAKDFCRYAIIGHSERRKYFHEDLQMLINKIDMCKESEIEPIYCVQNENDNIPEKISIVAYEPVFAIGTGNPDTPDNADFVSKKIKENKNIKMVLYGGSVNSKNIVSYLNRENIDGALIGSAGLDPKEFSSIIEKL